MRRALLVCLMPVISSTFAVAQLTEATLKGIVTDPIEGVIAAATVSARNEATGLMRSTVSDDSGAFLIAGIAPGSYTVTVDTAGFRAFRRKGLILNVGQSTQLNVRLDVADVQTNVDVNGGEITIPVATEGRLSDTLNVEITGLPLPQRDIFLLPKLSAGATFIPGAAWTSAKLVNSPVITVNGNRYRGNNYVLDGAANVNPNNTGEPGIVPSLEMVEEAQVQTGNFSSEFGRGNASVINIRTKSGTNSFHGKAWEYLRNSNLNARDFFAAERPPLKYNQFGASLGGPIIQNKTFFFMGYEGTRNVSGQVITSQVETPEFREYVASAYPNSVAARLLKQFPAPTPLPGTGEALYAGQIDLVTPQGVIPAIGRAAPTLLNHGGFDQYLTRVDHSFRNSLDKLSARWISEFQRHDGGVAPIAGTLAKAIRGERGPAEGRFSNMNVGYVHVFTRASTTRESPRSWSTRLSATIR